MKFGRQLEHEAVAEWRAFYLDYNKMKHALKDIKRVEAGEVLDIDDLSEEESDGMTATTTKLSLSLSRTTTITDNNNNNNNNNNKA
jgi:SPX domain protein involved in polyphosphate accumulation